jgi:dihydroorotase-like cyclic amidohydrolase
MTYRYKRKNNPKHIIFVLDKDYERLGMLIINNRDKNRTRQEGLLKRYLTIEFIITTDHAPHTLEEKQNPIFNLCQVHQWFSIRSIAC